MATKDTIEAYLAAWNEADEAKRAAILDRCWSAAGTYTDPLADVSGREALAQTVSAFHKQMPGASIALASGIDEHHGRIRFAWKVVTKEGTSPMEGIDIGQLDADGRLASIVGFWGSPPAA